jgi:TonB-dependent Receptor Plug Domain
MGFVIEPSIAKRPESGAPSIRELHSKGSRPAIDLCVVGLTLGAVSVCAEDNRGALEEIRPTVPLPTITVEARRPAFEPAFEINSVTVLDRDTLARSEERELNGVLRGLPGVILQTPGSRGTLSSLFVRGVSAGLGQLSFDGVPLYSSVNGAFNLATVPADATAAFWSPPWRHETHPEGPLKSSSPALIETSMTDEYNEQKA